jgi:hypothetical protein
MRTRLSTKNYSFIINELETILRMVKIRIPKRNTGYKPKEKGRFRRSLKR